MSDCPDRLDKKYWSRFKKNDILAYDKTASKDDEKCLLIPGKVFPKVNKTIATGSLDRKLDNGKTFKRVYAIVETSRFWNSKRCLSRNIVYIEYCEDTKNQLSICIVTNGLEDLLKSLKPDTLKKMLPNLPEYIRIKVSELENMREQPYIPIFNWGLIADNNDDLN